MYQFQIQWKRNRLLIGRSLTLISGFCINLIIANFFLKNFGETQFAIYIFISSLPILLNFLDFGLGTAAYNSQVDGIKISHSYNEKSQVELSSIYLLSLIMIILSLALIGAANLFFPNLFNVALFSKSGNNEILMIGFLLICFAIPFTISHKVLQASNRNLELILLQGLIPCLSLIIVYVGYVSGVEDISLLANPVALLVIAVWAFIRSKFTEKIEINLIILNLKSRISALIHHGFLSLTALIIINILLFLPRYILAQNGDDVELVHLSFMLMFLVSAQSLISADAQAQVTSIRISNEFEQAVKIRKATIKCLILALILSLGMFLASLLGEKLDIRILTRQEALFASFLLIVWALQIVTSSVNSQTKNIPFFISIYAFSLVFAIMVSSFIQIVTFSQIVLLVIAPTSLIASIGIILKFKFKIRK
jgi:hypothetical protein